jgi:hypothetical protein
LDWFKLRLVLDGYNRPVVVVCAAFPVFRSLKIDPADAVSELWTEEKSNYLMES